jgi:ABC-2 type transport system ATP-binding protein
MEIDLVNVSKCFARKPVLNHLSLTAHAGEILCLLGPSGAGKTTLIRLITGSIRPDEGAIYLDHIKLPSRPMSRIIGYMPQNDAVYTDLSGYDNLLFFGRLYGLKGQELKKRADDSLDLVDMQSERHKLVINYSGGMKKRLSLAIALLHNPQILLLDEPTIGVDPVLRKTIWNRFDVLRQSGKTIIVSTHVMDEATRCQKAALLYDGWLIENDSIPNLLARTKSGSLEELFLMVREKGEPS